MLRGKVQTTKVANAVQRFTAVSLSRLVDWRECPYKAKLKYLDKLPGSDKGSAAMDRGSEIHELGKQWVDAKGKKPLPPPLKLFKKQFTAALPHKPFSEKQWAFDREWNEVEWFAKTAYCRIITDMGWVEKKANVLHIVDWKTGKEKDFHDWQMGLYSLGGLRAFPRVEKVVFEFWYLDSGVKKSVEVERDEEKSLMTGWEYEFKPMLTDTSFKPKQGNYCKWCPFAKSKGGPCRYA